MYDLARKGEPVRLTPREPDGNRVVNAWPLWTPDGNHVLYSRTDQTWVRLMMARADGSDETVTLWSRAPGGPAWLYPMSFSPDGTFVLVFGATPAKSFDIFALRLRNADGSTSRNAVLEEPVPNTRFGDAFPQVSPRGDAIAFTSDQSGQYEVFVSVYPGGERRCRVSNGGGMDPSWTPDGKAIVYQSTMAFMVAEVHSVDPCNIGEPRMLFKGPFFDRPGFGHDITADGRLLLIDSEEFLKTSSTLQVITNLGDEIQRRLAVNR